MNSKINTCVYVDRGTLETAKRLDLNVSRVSENALADAISRLKGAEPETGLESRARGKVVGPGPGFEPGR